MIERVVDREEFIYPTIDTAQRIMDFHGLYVRDIGALASAIERPQQVVWGTEAYVGLNLKAAVLLDAINRSHPLIDGNKRLAFLLVARFYDLNGYDLLEDPEANNTFIRNAIEKDWSLKVLVGWLEGRVDKRDEPFDEDR